LARTVDFVRQLSLPRLGAKRTSLRFYTRRSDNLSPLLGVAAISLANSAQQPPRLLVPNSANVGRAHHGRDRPIHASQQRQGRVSVGSVIFEPGARTAWHTHPLGKGRLMMQLAEIEIDPAQSIPLFRPLGPYSITTARDRAPTRTKLSAQIVSRLNQLRDMNLRPR